MFQPLSRRNQIRNGSIFFWRWYYTWFFRIWSCCLMHSMTSQHAKRRLSNWREGRLWHLAAITIFVINETFWDVCVREKGSTLVSDHSGYLELRNKTKQTKLFHFKLLFRQLYFDKYVEPSTNLGTIVAVARSQARPRNPRILQENWWWSAALKPEDWQSSTLGKHAALLGDLLIFAQAKPCAIDRLPHHVYVWWKSLWWAVGPSHMPPFWILDSMVYHISNWSVLHVRFSLLCRFSCNKNTIE